MAYNEKLAARIREAIAEIPGVEEKKMFRGITFMLNDKMCVSVGDDEMMCRIGPDNHDEAAEKNGVREMIRQGTVMKGFVFVSSEVLKTKKDLMYWIGLSLAFNDKAKKSKRRSK